MIIARSPLRITLGGGGTDLPSYYEKFGGYCVAAAIDKYVYITVNDTFTDDLIVKYSKLERVKDASEVQHPIVRACLEMMELNGRGMEITSMADIPAGTGLGSSSAFTCALLRALYAYKRMSVSPAQIAESACSVEITRLKEPIGKQDQYASAIGGVIDMVFDHTGNVLWNNLNVQDIEDHTLLFFTGYSRSASAILKTQDDKTKSLDLSLLDNLHRVKAEGHMSRKYISCGDIHQFGTSINRQWELKEQRTQSPANVVAARELGLKSGAIGCKLIGAGGGGFLLFVTEDRARLRAAMANAGLREVRYHVDYEGTKLL